ILADHLAAGQDRDVLEHRLAAVAEAGRLHRRDLEAAAQLVDDQGRQRLALDILGDDEERLARLHHRLEDGEHRLQARELLLVQQDVRALQLADHLLGIGDEVRREIAAVELHALDDVELGLEALRLLDRDDALIADLLRRLRDHLADLAVAIRGDDAHLGDLVIGSDLARALLHVGDHRLDSKVDAALQVHRVHAGGDGLRALADDRLRQHGRRGRAVTGEVAGLHGDFLDHLGAHVLELVGKLDLLGDGDAVLGDARRAERLVEHDVAALRPQRYPHRVGENVDAAQHPLARVAGKSYVLGRHVSLSPPLHATLRAADDFPSTIPMMSDSFMMRISSPSILTSVPDHLPKRTKSPLFTSGMTRLPFSSKAPGPTEMTSPSWGFSWAVSGMMIPPAVF